MEDWQNFLLFVPHSADFINLSDACDLLIGANESLSRWPLGFFLCMSNLYFHYTSWVWNYDFNLWFVHCIGFFPSKCNRRCTFLSCFHSGTSGTKNRVEYEFSKRRWEITPSFQKRKECKRCIPYSLNFMEFKGIGALGWWINQ